MPSSSTLVNTDEASELRLVHFLGSNESTAPFVLTCETHITKADAPSLLRTILAYDPAFDVLMKDRDELSVGSDDGINAFSLLCALLDRLESEADVDAILKQLVDKVEGYEAKKGASTKIVEKKMKMLCALYNLRSNAREKCWLLGRILNVCAFGGDEDCVLSLLPGRHSTLGTLLEGTNLERLLMGLETDGELTQQDKRTLIATASAVVGKVADVCREKDMDKEALALDGCKQRFLLKILSTYVNVTDVDAEALSAAKEAAIGAICDPVTLFNEQRCIMSLPPVMALEKDAGTKPLYALLSIFQQGKLDDFQSFQKTHPKALSQYSICPNSAIRHMRLLSLCSLATEHEEIPYDAIATTLQVEQSDVESWVIDAVSSDLLSAKMNQLEKVVLVERCVVRRFGIEQWKILQQRLDVWKKNVGSVVEGLRKSQATAGQ